MHQNLKVFITIYSDDGLVKPNKFANFRNNKMKDSCDRRCANFIFFIIVPFTKRDVINKNYFTFLLHSFVSEFLALQQKWLCCPYLLSGGSDAVHVFFKIRSNKCTFSQFAYVTS